MASRMLSICSCHRWHVDLSSHAGSLVDCGGAVPDDAQPANNSTMTTEDYPRLGRFRKMKQLPARP
jgi:hypothetical protein